MEFVIGKFIMIFFIRTQQKKLNRHFQQPKLNNYAKKKSTNSRAIIPTPEMQRMLDNVNQACSYYYLRTKTASGRLLSIIPGTEPFKARSNCVRLIKLAFIQMRSSNKQAKQFVNTQPPGVQLRRSRSAPDVPQPKIYPSLFTKPRAKDDLDIRDRFTSKLRIS